MSFIHAFRFKFYKASWVNTDHGVEHQAQRSRTLYVFGSFGTKKVKKPKKNRLKHYYASLFPRLLCPSASAVSKNSQLPPKLLCRT